MLTLMIKLPDKDCALCPRLKAFRDVNREKFPDQFNAPVPFWGPQDAQLLIVGLAPGLKGANFTGRPFTGDYAGDLLYSTLVKFGFAAGEYKARPDDGLELVNCRITNAVKCVPPENKPTGDEIKTCQTFLSSEIETMPKLKCILSLGKISHDAVLRTHGEKLGAYKFAHNATHKIRNDLYLIDSYHCSRYNTQTNRLTEAMFHEVFERIINLLTKI